MARSRGINTITFSINVATIYRNMGLGLEKGLKTERKKNIN